MAENAQDQRKPLEGVKGGPVGYGNPPRSGCFTGADDPRRNNGGRPRGADIVAPLLAELAEGAEFDAEGNVTKYGTRSVELARVWRGLSSGEIDPATVDCKALLALVDRVNGPLVKERINTNIEVLQDVELRDRRERPAPGTETPKP